jgi:hypothetical protein
MKNKKVLFLILTGSILVLPTFVSAACTTLICIVTNVVNQLKPLSIGLSTIAFVVAGIMFLSATGNPQRMAIAKGALIAAVTGIVILVLAAGAQTFVQNFFGV